MFRKKGIIRSQRYKGQNDSKGAGGTEQMLILQPSDPCQKLGMVLI